MFSLSFTQLHTDKDPPSTLLSTTLDLLRILSPSGSLFIFSFLKESSGSAFLKTFSAEH